MNAIDLINRLNQAVEKPETRTEHTTLNLPMMPGGIGTIIDPRLNAEPKAIVHRLSQDFPIHGLEPEQRAALNMAAKLAEKAAEDSQFYTKKADAIGGSMAKIHVAQTENKANMLEHDLTMKQADVKLLGSVETWQSKTMSLLETAREKREKHAGINLLQAAI